MKTTWNSARNPLKILVIYVTLSLLILSGCKEEMTVTTNPVTNISYTSATCGGKILEDGNADIIARGVCWSTNQSPTVNDSKTMNGTGIGSYTSDLASHELNLVLKSGKRINVLDHSSLMGIRTDARMLSEFIIVPIFDRA